MEIRYTISLEDHKAYHHEIRSAVPGLINIRCLQSLGGPAFLLLMLWLFTNLEYGWWPTLLGVIPAVVLGIYLWRESPGLWKQANLEAMYSQGKLAGHIGEHSLELREDGVLERNSGGEHLSHWDQIENIHLTDQRAFFVTRTQLAYILPKSAIVEGDYEKFLEKAIADWKRLARKPPASS